MSISITYDHQTATQADLGEKLAWVHHIATQLTTSDLVELKYTLRHLAKESVELHDMVRTELQSLRPKSKTHTQRGAMEN